MKPQSKSERSRILSSYLDRELDEMQTREVEALLSGDAEARNELEQLRALKNLLASKKALPPSVGFWTRFAIELENRKREEENLLPFPRKYLPLISVGTAVALLVIGIVLFQQRANVVEYVSRQSERVQKAVEDNVLKGTLMPLFTHIDKNQALQFAMFGTLPLDAKAETELRVNEDSLRVFSIDLDKKGERRTPAVTVKEFVDEVQPSYGQLQIIDSLLDLGRAKLEGSVLVAGDRAMAVNPELSRLNRVMLSGIAATLEPYQRVRFDRFLQARKAPYMLAGGRRGPESRERILHTMRTPDRPGEFLVLSPETLLVSRIAIDFDSLRRHVREMAQVETTVAVHMNNFLRRMTDREMAMNEQINTPRPKVRVHAEEGSFTIQIGSGWEGMPPTPPETWVRPRMPIQVGSAGSRSRNESFDLPFVVDDSSVFFNLDMDSLMILLQKEGEAGAAAFFKGDPRSGGRELRMDPRTMQQYIDKAFQGKKHKISKLDSLMNEMEKRERQRERSEKVKKDPLP
jgi:hypothetical protein